MRHPRPPLPNWAKCQQPLTPADTLVDTSACRLDDNELCGLNMYGTYTAEGIIKLSDALKINKTLTSLRCAIQITFLIWHVSAAADTC